MANMKDVAVKANVSVSTVSHVINKTRFVSPEVQERVHHAMDDLGYIPNVMAHSLRTKKSNTIGIVVPINLDENSNIFIMQIVLGIDEVLRESGYFTLLANTMDELPREIEEIRSMLTRQIDGMIIIPSRGDQGIVPQLLKNKEYVFVDRLPQGLAGEDCVLCDSFGASYDAVGKMIKHGHKKLGVLCAELGRFSNSDERVEGYKKALQDNGIKINPDYICGCASDEEEAQRKTKWLVEKTDVTGIFITANKMGIGAMRYLQQAKVKIPDEISLTVFDDYAWNQICSPAITAIRQDAYELGVQSARLLLQKLNGENETGTSHEIRLPAQLIIRESW